MSEGNNLITELGKMKTRKEIVEIATKYYKELYGESNGERVNVHLKYGSNKEESIPQY